MRFWKFEYEGEAYLRHCIDVATLHPPSQEGPELQRSESRVLAAMAAGDGLVLAHLDGECAEIHAIGRVLERGTASTPPLIHWAATRKRMFPEPGEELNTWRTRSAFEIPPARTAALREIAAYFVRGEPPRRR